MMMSSRRQSGKYQQYMVCRRFKPGVKNKVMVDESGWQEMREYSQLILYTSILQY